MLNLRYKHLRAGTGGSISPSGTTNVNYGGKQKYTITPNAGYVLDTLFVNGIKVDSITSYTFDTVKVNKTIVAKFKVQTFTITSSAGTGGSISPSGTTNVNYAGKQKYTITPNAGYVLDTLFVNGIKVDSNTSYTFDTVKVNKTIVAKFKVQTFTITSSAGTGGSISPFRNNQCKLCRKTKIYNHAKRWICVGYLVCKWYKSRFKFKLYI